MQYWIFDIRSRSFVLLTILFLVITALVYFGITENFDQSIALSVSQTIGNPTVDAIMQYVTESGDVFNMMAFGILMLIIPKTRRVGITLMILIVISTLLTGYIKCGIDRNEPDFEYQGVPFYVEISRDTYALFCKGGFDASYPSGHAARAMIFGIILGYALSERFPRGAYLLFLYPVMVSVSRIYVLQHFPMDVIGGTVIGVMLAGVMAKRTKLYKIFDKSKT
ncbi:phosphatase PAP2 family protein [Nitrosopumilus sp.]|uniref:phosphatase PAP2 family protein n=1 Tax=Nitrosopumilus sp. TaxID=2024843 RepID=UPI00292CD715|nr:phosphatase PAP2 family protein [Nitrosopumilus sp.]